MTVAQARPGSGARTDNHAARLAAIQPPKITEWHRNEARDKFIRLGGADLLEMVGLDEGERQ